MNRTTSKANLLADFVGRRGATLDKTIRSGELGRWRLEFANQAAIGSSL